MLKNSKEFSKLKSEWRKWKDELVDIFVFGSFVKGKSQPNDIDICLVFRNDVTLEIVKKIEAILGENYHICFLSADNFFTNPHSLARTLLLEGKSIISGKNFADSFGLRAEILYSYNLSAESPSKKVRFVYLLRGRGSSEGLVKKWKGEFISNNAFLVPVDKDNEVLKVFEMWKVKFSRKKIMLMS